MGAVIHEEASCRGQLPSPWQLNCNVVSYFPQLQLHFSNYTQSAACFSDMWTLYCAMATDSCSGGSGSRIRQSIFDELRTATSIYPAWKNDRRKTVILRILKDEGE